jgi:hypothetical protein
MEGGDGSNFPDLSKVKDFFVAMVGGGFGNSSPSEKKGSSWVWGPIIPIRCLWRYCGWIRVLL